MRGPLDDDVSPMASPRQPPPRSTSRPWAPGHPPARAGPRLPRPIGRSHLSAGEITPGSWAFIKLAALPTARVTNKEKEVRCNARRRQRDEHGKQALTKPQKKVGVPQKKWRTEEGKGGEPAVPGRPTCGSGHLRRQISQRWVSLGSSRSSRDRNQIRRYVLTNYIKHLLKGVSGLSRPERVSRRALGALKLALNLVRNG